MSKSATAILAVLMCAGVALAQEKSQDQSVTQVLDGDVKMIEGELVPAAEAMPEDKYGFAPTNGEFKGVPNVCRPGQARRGGELPGRRRHPR